MALLSSAIAVQLYICAVGLSYRPHICNCIKDAPVIRTAGHVLEFRDVISIIFTFSDWNAEGRLTSQQSNEGPMSAAIVGMLW